MSPCSPTRAAGVFALLVLPVAATAALAWTLHRDGEALRAKADDLQQQQTRLRGQLTALDERQESLQRELAQVQAARPAQPGASSPMHSHPNVTGAAPGPRPAAIGASATGSHPPSPTGPHGNVYFPELFDDPHYTQLYLTHFRALERARYAPLFAELAGSLSPDTIARLHELLAQRTLAMEDVDGILQLQAMQAKTAFNPADASRTKAIVRQRFEAELKENFGEETFARLRAFENGMGARQELIDKLELRLSYSPAPLERSQALALTDLYRRARSGIPPGDDALSEEFVRGAETILKPAQASALKELRAELNASRIGGSSFSIRTAPNAPPPRTLPRPRK